MIAILTHNADEAVRELGWQRVLEDYSAVTRKGMFCSGREFVVVTKPEQVNGMRLSDYRIIGKPTDELIAAARKMM